MEYASIDWRDGQPYSRDFADVYYSVNDGLGESEYVFLQQNNLPERFSSADRFVIAETGFGTGLNFALTLRLWDQCAPASARLDYFGIEFAPLSPEDIRRVAAQWPVLAHYFDELLKHYPLPVTGRHLCIVLNHRVRLHLCFMDVCAALQDESLKADAWYLDGFAPSTNPEIWNEKVFGLITQNSACNASLATYSAAGFVRRGLEHAGFKVEKRRGHGNKREMISATLLQPRDELAFGEPWTHLPRTRHRDKHAVVLGAGLAGLAVAWSLIRRGWRITLVDRHEEVAGEASGNPVGLVLPRISVDDSRDARFYRAAFLHAIAALDILEAGHAGENTNRFWKQQGVYCGMRTSRVQRMFEKNSFHPEYMQPVSARTVNIEMPVDSSLLLVPRAGWASPEWICQAMRAACGDALQYTHALVSSLSQVQAENPGANTAWHCLSATGQSVAAAEVLVLANGVMANSFSQTRWLPIRSARGQLTELKLKPGAQPPIPSLSFGHYLAPGLKHESGYYCGASYQLDDADTALRDSDQQANIDFLQDYFPGLFEVPDKLQGRTGFRAVSDDRMPVVGPVPDMAWFDREYHDLHHGRSGQGYASAQYLPGLYASAAHGSRGMTSCFLSAEVVAAEIESTPAPLEQDIINALNPARFIIRRLKRGG